MTAAAPDTQTPKAKPKVKTNSGGNSKRENDKVALMVPAYFFGFVCFILSLGVNTYNVFKHINPTTEFAFESSGSLDALTSMPTFVVGACAFRVAMAWGTWYILNKMGNDRDLVMNPVWLFLLFVPVYLFCIGLANIVYSIPFLVSLSIVAGIQFFEIFFWSARRRTIGMWFLVVGAYTLEFWLQYDMAPVHSAHPTFLSALMAMVQMTFTPEGLKPLLLLLLVLSLFGTEFGAHIVRMAKKSV